MGHKTNWFSLWLLGSFAHLIQNSSFSCCLPITLLTRSSDLPHPAPNVSTGWLLCKKCSSPVNPMTHALISTKSLFNIIFPALTVLGYTLWKSTTNLHPSLSYFSPHHLRCLSLSVFLWNLFQSSLDHWLTFCLLNSFFAKNKGLNA